MPHQFVDVTLIFTPPAPESIDGWPFKRSETLRLKLSSGAGAALVEKQIASQLGQLGYDGLVITNAIHSHRRLLATAAPARRPWNSAL
jgi:hypothetical protein